MIPNLQTIHYNRLRKVLGWLGILFPVVLFISSYCNSDCCHIQNSISSYYYTPLISVFCGVLFGIGLFLFTYAGFDALDNHTTNLAGLLAFCVAVFPTVIQKTDSCNTGIASSPATLGAIHLGCAALLFIILGIISFFLFTKSHKDGTPPTPEKRLRNKIYRVCGVVMWLCITLIALDMKGYIVLSHWLPSFLKPTFSFETLALWAFGTSWLIKGETLFADGSNSYNKLPEALKPTQGQTNKSLNKIAD